MLALSPGTWKDEKGAAAVEFAIVATLLFLIVFGIIEFGKFFGEYEALVSAAREGGRKAAVRADDTVVKDAVVNAATPYTIQCAGNTGTACITVDPAPGGTSGTSCNDGNVGTDVRVYWDQEFQLSFPLVPPISQTVHVEGVFRCE